MSRKVVTVFGSARPTPGEPEYDLAHALGRAVALGGYDLCNGGYGGTMEAAAAGFRGARNLEAFPGQTAVGVTCALLGDRHPNRWIDRDIRTRTLFERVETLIRLGDGFVVLPGGTGTLLELAATWELFAKHFERPRRVVLLGGFWDSIASTIAARLRQEGFLDVDRQVLPAASVAECMRLLTDSWKEETDGG